MSIEMKSIIGIGCAIGTATVFALCGVSVGLGEDFTWDGSGGNSNWTNAANWTTDDTGAGFPDQNGVDNATINNPLIISGCTFDYTTDLTLEDLTLGGDSPTTMILNVSGADLTAYYMLFDPFGRIEVQNDREFTVTRALQGWGPTFVKTYGNGICNLGPMETQDPDVISPGGSGITWGLATDISASGALTAQSLAIDADNPPEGSPYDQEGFRFNGSGDTLTINCGALLIRAQQEPHEYDGEECLDCETHREATLWLEAGTIEVVSTECGTSTLEIDGGDSATYRRAILDIDGDLTAETTNILSGFAAIDVAAFKTLRGGDLTFETEVVAVKTGSGVVKSGN